MFSRFRLTPDRCVLIGLLFTAAVYCQDLRYDFILDDMALILMNNTIASPHNWKLVFVKDAFFVKGASIQVARAMHYRPVFVLWLMLNHLLFGGVFPWWHLTSLLLHLAVVFLVFRLASRLLKDQWTSVLAALLFAFHPIHAESVSYVSASTDLLVTLFLLLAFFGYARFREDESSPVYLAIAVFTAALAMLSKETGAMFPFVLVAYEALRDHPPTEGARWKRYVWTLPFFAVVAMYVSVRFLLFGRNMGPGPGGSPLAALADIPLVLMVYLRNLLWPFRLSFFYPIEWSSQWTVWKGIAFLLLLGAIAYLWNRLRSRNALRLQLLWALILFVPPVMAVAGLLRGDWVHDRHAYLVSVPFCLLAAALLTDNRIPQKFSLVASSVVLALLLFETAVTVPRFSDGVTVYETALRVAPRSALAHRFLACALMDYGRYEEALQVFRVAVELAPGDATLHATFGDALDQRGQYAEAAIEYESAARLSLHPTPNRAFFLFRLASIELRNAMPESAESHVREAIQIAPDSRNYHAMLADALREEGRTQEADEQMRLEAIAQKTFLRSSLDPN